MNVSELGKLIAAVIILTISWSFLELIIGDIKLVPQILFFSTIIVFVSIFSKKIMAYLVDADVEHDIWRMQRFWFFPGSKLPSAIPAGIILPLFLSIFSLGLIKFSSILTYETRVRKSRKARRFGYYSYSEMTDWHNGIIGASGIISVLALGGIAYFLPTNIELLTKMAVYYAFWNILPISNFDGTQIFFGSRTLWAILATLTLILTALALII